MGNDVLIVLSNPIDEEHDAEFNDWYTNTHLPEVLQVPGIVSAQRFKLSPEQLPADFLQSKHSYLAIYEIDVPPSTAFEGLMDAVAAGKVVMTPVIDVANTGTWAFSPLTAVARAGNAVPAQAS